MSKPIVEFHSVSKWQKRGCLFCPQDAIQEAVYYPKDKVRVSIRCCTNPGCMKEAKKMALAHGEIFLDVEDETNNDWMVGHKGG